jgi:hypothetical protein
LSTIPRRQRTSCDARYWLVDYIAYAGGFSKPASTAYHWRAQDEKFADEWDNAIETGLDLLEHSVYERGLKEGGEDAHFILRGRRRDVFGHAGDAAPRPTSKMIRICV